ncbi:hypothetical protein GGI23_002540 [Coemansia sp. RSA 2559]|nr:hypothetical protein GGI23_002540 [Coemansia sp. RSA 2559]
MRALPPNTFFTADVKLNKLRRRQLGNPYSLPSIRIYEDAILEHGVLSLITLWDKKIAASQNEKKALVNFYYGFHGMMFDIIGVLGFGKSFDIVATGSTKLTESVANTLKLSVIRAGVPFGSHLLWLFRNRASGLRYVLTSAAEMVKKRKQENSDAANANGEDRKRHFDILQRLIDARDPVTGASIDDKSLVAEIFLLLVGGTDTTSSTLGSILPLPDTCLVTFLSKVRI